MRSATSSSRSIWGPSRRGPAATTVWLALVCFAGLPALAERPNIVVFLVDDLGWMDTAVFGSRYYETPNIDRLAGAGMLFTDAYAASPHCSPTRASILTGKYPARLGITSAAGASPPWPDGAARFPTTAGRRMKWLLPISRRLLPLAEITLAEAMRAHGYRTAHIGKWHLGLEPQYWPGRQGFDHVFHGAPDSGPPSYFSPYGFLHGSITDGPDGEYLTDRLTDEALHFLETSRDQPFLLHLAHFGVHGPWGYKEELRREFAGRADPSDRQGNPIMAAMIASIDESLGRIVAKLDELGLTERTIIILFSDNGGAMHARLDANGMLPTDNSPLRGAKGLLYEGGIRVPLIVSWPGVTEPGSRRAELVSSIDFFPTILEAAGISRDGRELDGESIVPLLRGSARGRRIRRLRQRAIFNHFAIQGLRAPPGVTVHKGRWKLIRWFQTTPWFPRELELYDLEQDIGETVNRAGDKPRLARRLNAQIDRFLHQAGVPRPRPNPDYSHRAAVLGGWIPSNARVEIEDGVLRCLPEKESGRPARLGLQLNRHEAELEPVVDYALALRARAEKDLQGRVTLSDPKTAEVEQTVAFDLSGGSRWRELSLRILVSQARPLLRLEFDVGASGVEIDSIRLRRVDGRRVWPTFTPAQEWEFDLPDRPPEAGRR